MKRSVRFAVIPLDGLHAHEAVVEEKVANLAAELQRAGTFLDPIWVAQGTDVILNGHHRAAALRQLGAQRIPAWLIDYDSEVVRLERWTPGPPVSKAEVLRRARTRKLFPPRTTRHILLIELPPRSVPLRDLLPVGGHTGRSGASRRSASARGSRARASPPG